MTGIEWVAVVGITLFGAMTQAATGFGLAIIVTPFLVVIMNSTGAVQLVIVVTLILQVWLTPRAWRLTNRRVLWHLLLGSAVGLPVGVYAFLQADVTTIKLATGSCILLFTGLTFIRGAVEGHTDPAGLPMLQSSLTGGVAGAMGTALAMPGPAPMIYLVFKGVAKDVVRATVVTYLTFAYVVSTLLHAFVVGIPLEIWRTAAILAPAVIGGALVGAFLAPRISQRLFRALVLGVLTGTGVYAIYTAL